MRRIHPALVLAVSAAAALSWWLAQLGDKTPTMPTDQRGPRAIDYHVTGFDVTRMTAEGSPAHRLRARYMQHFTDDDTTELQQPHLTVYQAEAPPWEVDAERAWLSADGSLLLLQGDVLIERAGDAVNRPIRITTRDLRVQPRQDYAETDEKVRVEGDTDWIDAVGMQAWMRPPSRLKFLSQVKAYYVPR
jgi:lipopolysaccharide export system protein LptC